ncbi:SAF domain-containing protein [Cellulomonas pakistanensis]|uniref:SAF domain-containing protein n=1 Tax=Cellulomonas pakistanensis TaxID=992287 RepID=A0A919U6M8_9CELL|nr:SAF domain-containing protein [Cellulomonas pakistanensis]GIG36192.1 hypothetical protein Cpa01nite_15730 [Cellulomonas pakistanensis]
MPLTDPLPEPVRRRLRVVAWRARRPLAALCAGLAAVIAVGLLRPADPPTARVPVAARALAVGAVLAVADVSLADVPVALLPTTLLVATPTAGDLDAAEDDFVGRRLAVPVPAGLPLVAELLVDESGTGPPGSVVVPVRFADAGVADVLRPGMRVDVVAAALHDGDEALRLAEAAVVLAQPGDADDGGTSGSGSGLLGGGTTTGESSPVLLAVDPDESVALSGAAASRVLSAVIVG